MKKLSLLLFCGIAILSCNQRSITTNNIDKNEQFKNCLDSLGGSDMDCIDCQMKVYGAVIDTTYLL